MKLVEMGGGEGGKMCCFRIDHQVVKRKEGRGSTICQCSTQGKS